MLHIARQRRDVVFALHAQHRIPPTVPRELSFELNERCSVDGNILVAIDEEEAGRLIEIIDEKVDVIAISFLHSYKNGENEKRVAEIARKKWRYVTTSHETSAEAREFERTLVTVLNAGLLPMMSGFLNSIGECGLPLNRVQLFHSAGGMISTSTASRFPLLLAMSGPAAGVEAAGAVARELETLFRDHFGYGRDYDGLQFACGWPSRDANGQRRRQASGSPADGCGRIDRGRRGFHRTPLRRGLGLVGPDSAGSDPGPACYNRGGRLPTSTDAMVILGDMGSGSPKVAPFMLIAMQR